MLTLCFLAALAWWVTAGLDNGSPLAPDVPAAASLVVVVAWFTTYRMARTMVQLRRSHAAGTALGRLSAAGWILAAVVLVGLIAVASLSALLAGVSDVDVGPAVAVGATAAGLAFLPGLLYLPGVARNPAVRLRHLLDGVSVGLCLMFTSWVLVMTPHGRIDTPHFWLAMLSACVLATVALIGARSGFTGRLRTICAAGVGAVVLGMHGMSAVLTNHLPLGWASAMGLLVAAGLMAVCWGATAAPTAPAVAPSTPASDRARRAWCPWETVVATPALVAFVVALHRLATGGDFDRAGMMLGTLAALAVGLRQSVATRLAVARSASALATAARESSSTVDGQVAAQGQMDARQLYDRAYADPFTGLANRDRLWLSVAAMRGAPRRQGAVLAVGIDAIKTVGAAGSGVSLDAVVLQVAHRLRIATGADEPSARGTTVARLAGTEFAVLTGKGLVHAYGLATRLLRTLAEPLDVDGSVIRPSVTIGIADLAGAASTDDVLLRAGTALRRARQTGGGKVEWYDPAVEGAIERREILERELPDALRRGELDLLYQPIMDLVRGRPLAVEALLRWRHPRLGTLLPADVIPVAEDLGIIGDVGHWVLGHASAQLATWLRHGRDISMSVNISPRELGASELATQVSGVLAAHAIPPDRLVLEVAESGLDDGTALADRVAALRSVGVRTALDEFGTGATSLAHLRSLPIDMVKIGRSFFEEAPAAARPGRVPAARTAQEAAPLIEVLVGVGRRLGVDVVAHGLEAPAHLDLVRTAGCRIGQGHLFAHPQPAERTEAYLDGFPARTG